MRPGRCPADTIDGAAGGGSGIPAALLENEDPPCPSSPDTHTLLLAHAAQRGSGSLFPLPDALAGTARTIKALASLLRQGLVAEQETRVAAEIAR